MAVAQKKDRKYTYQDYLASPDEERWEIIDGQAYNMTPAPSTAHQRAANRINILLATHTSLPRGCQVFIAPTDVVLSESDVVQPDVFVVCDQGKVTELNIQGAPDLVVEVLSPATALKDKREKKALYERGGVREFIVIDPIERYVERYALDAHGRYGHPDLLGSQEVLTLKVFGGLEIPLHDVFE